MKKIITLLLCAVMAIGMMGCSFSIGGGSKSENKSYKEIFPDRASEQGLAYKTGYMAYDFTAGNFGEMKVYVDTSEGHSFKVDSENGGFFINDESGKEVLHAYVLDPSVYKQVTAEINSVRTINGRDFFVMDNDEKKVYHAVSYLADCGMDCGIILEAYEDPEILRLVAFDGTPIENANSDIYYYKGESLEASDNVEEEQEATVEEEEKPLEAETAENEISEGETAEAKSADATNLLSEDAKMLLENLGSDYSNINWGVVYPVDEQSQGLVISIAPYIAYDEVNLMVAITNLYDKAVSFTASASALGENDAVVGDTFLYYSAIGSGNTVVSSIACRDGMPDGRIRWEDCDITLDTFQEYIPWEGDYEVSGNPAEGSLTVSYTVYSATKEAIEPGLVTIALLDEKGNIMAVGCDYVDETVEAGDEYQGTIKVYEDEELLSHVKGAAMFVESVK